MTAFPTAADCMRLVDLGSHDPRGIQFDAALSLLYGTGCLPSELGLLRIVDIVRAERQAEVSFAGARAGGPAARCVILSGRVKAVVDRHFDPIVGPPERLVFRSSRGGPLNLASLNTEIARRSAVYGFPAVLTAADLRRGCVRHCLERGMSPEQLGASLGLKDVNRIVALARGPHYRRSLE